MALAIARSRAARYLALRPALLWSLLSLALFISLLFLVRLSGGLDTMDQTEYTALELVPMSMPRSHTQPDIAVSRDAAEERVEPEKEEEKPLSFGDESGEYGDNALVSRAPVPLYASLPEYPRSMKKAGIEGVVVIELGIDETGRLLYGRIIRSLGKEFDQATAAWVKSIRYRPGADREGRPIRCRVRLPVRFRLEE